MSDLEFREIYPKIFVYTNVFKDVSDTLNVILESKNNPEGSAFHPWKSWYTFGTELDMIDKSKSETDRQKKEQEIYQEINDIFYKTTKHYSEVFNLPIDPEEQVVDNFGETLFKWRKMGPSICEYFVDGGIENNKDLAMNYHSDFQIEYVDWRGYKFAVTCTMYLNDDYDGGEIDFFVNNKLLKYKPKAGDVIVFPAGDPNYLSDEGVIYLHGVKRVWRNSKYFIRNHWQWFYPGEENWLKEEEKYGKELWAEMEMQRIKEERSKGTYQWLSQEDLDNAERLPDV